MFDEKPKMYLDDPGEDKVVDAVAAAAAPSSAEAASLCFAGCCSADGCAADPVDTSSAAASPGREQKLCTMTEVRYLFSQEVRRLRLEHGYEDIYALSNACGRLRLYELMKLEVGLFESFSNIIALARFYDKKVKIVFY